jgi:hypothetical protein
MFYDSIKDGEHWDIDYVEVNDLDINQLHAGKIVKKTGEMSAPYDVYFFNYHPYTMREVEGVFCEYFHNLPGEKYAFIVEEIRDLNNPVVDGVPDVFNGYIVVDPTATYNSPKFHSFPRPLPKYIVPDENWQQPSIPIIGSFGYPTQDKGYDLVVRAVNEEFDNAIVRINLPQAAFADHDKSNVNKVISDCYAAAKPGIEVRITHDFMSDDELILWARQNTVNAFFYPRAILGVAASPDHAVASGRPIAVYQNPCFRNILQYQKPYPLMSLRETIATGTEYVAQMQKAWCKDACVNRLTEIIFGKKN